MPAPPPNGVSSTVRCLSVAKSRMSTASSRQRPSRKRLAGEANGRAGPGTSPGTASARLRSTVARRSCSRAPPRGSSPGSSRAFRQLDDDASPPSRSTTGTTPSVKGSTQPSPVAGSISISRRRRNCRRRRPCRSLARRMRARRQPDQVVMVEFVLVREPAEPRAAHKGASPAAPRPRRGRRRRRCARSPAVAGARRRSQLERAPAGFVEQRAVGGNAGSGSAVKDFT